MYVGVLNEFLSSLTRLKTHKMLFIFGNIMTE